MVKKEMMDPLFQKRKELNAESLKIDNAIKALQDICDHDYVSDGHDSHKSHYKCKMCRYTDSW